MNIVSAFFKEKSSVWFMVLGAFVAMPLFISVDIVNKAVHLYNQGGSAVYGPAHYGPANFGMITLPISFFIVPFLVLAAFIAGGHFPPLNRWLKWLLAFTLWMIGLGAYSILQNGLSVAPYLLQWLLPVVVLVCFVYVRKHLAEIVLGAYLMNFLVVYYLAGYVLLVGYFPAVRPLDNVYLFSIYQFYNYFPIAAAFFFYGITPFVFSKKYSSQRQKIWITAFLTLYNVCLFIVVWTLSARESLLFLVVAVVFFLAV